MKMRSVVFVWILAFGFTQASDFSECPELQKKDVVRRLAAAIAGGATPIVLFSPCDNWLRSDATVPASVTTALGLSSFPAILPLFQGADEGLSPDMVYLYLDDVRSLLSHHADEPDARRLSSPILLSDGNARLVFANPAREIDKRFVLDPSRLRHAPFAAVAADARELASSEFLEKYGVGDLFGHRVFVPVPDASFLLDIPFPDLPPVEISANDKTVLDALQKRIEQDKDRESRFSITQDELADILFLAAERSPGSRMKGLSFTSLPRDNPGFLLPDAGSLPATDLGKRVQANLALPAATRPGMPMPDILTEIAGLIDAGRFDLALPRLSDGRLAREAGFFSRLVHAACLARQGNPRAADQEFRALAQECGWNSPGSHVFPDADDNRHVDFGCLGRHAEIDNAFVENVLQTPGVFMIRFRKRPIAEAGTWRLWKGDNLLWSMTNAEIGDGEKHRFILHSGQFRLEYTPRIGTVRSWPIPVGPWETIAKAAKIPQWNPQPEAADADAEGAE